jgi:hypothetical protein
MVHRVTSMLTLRIIMVRWWIRRSLGLLTWAAS